MQMLGNKNKNSRNNRFMKLLRMNFDISKHAFVLKINNQKKYSLLHKYLDWGNHPKKCYTVWSSWMNFWIVLITWGRKCNKGIFIYFGVCQKRKVFNYRLSERSENSCLSTTYQKMDPRASFRITLHQQAVRQ